mgnify:CR=1 FL=1
MVYRCPSCGQQNRLARARPAVRPSSSQLTVEFTHADEVAIFITAITLVMAVSADAQWTVREFNFHAIARPDARHEGGHKSPELRATENALRTAPNALDSFMLYPVAGTFGKDIAISPEFTRDARALETALPVEIESNAPTPLWRAVDQAMGAFDRPAGATIIDDAAEVWASADVLAVVRQGPDSGLVLAERPTAGRGEDECEHGRPPPPPAATPG